MQKSQGKSLTPYFSSIFQKVGQHESLTGAVVKWIEALSYGAEGRWFESAKDQLVAETFSQSTQ